jgi:hypothetical protein
MSDHGDRLDELAAHVADNPYFLAWALAAYQRRHRLSDLALAAALHCDPSVLLDLRLCRRPVPEGERFEEDVRVISERFGCDRAALLLILKEAGGQGEGQCDQTRRRAGVKH